METGARFNSIMAVFWALETKFWTNSGLRKVSGIGRALFAFVLTSPQRNVACLYAIPVEDIARSTGFSETECSAALGELSEKEFIRYDFEREIVWAINAIKHQFMNPNMRVSARRDFEQCSSIPIKKEFSTIYSEFLELKPFSSTTLTKGFANPPIISSSIYSPTMQEKEKSISSTTLTKGFDEQNFVVEIMPLWKSTKFGGVATSFEQSNLFECCKEFGNAAVREAIVLYAEGGYKAFGRIKQHLDPENKFRMKGAKDVNVKTNGYHKVEQPEQKYKIFR